ncbi:MAG: acyltransferase [Myxococcota bacterium]|nr:acyltransferase [Myxococcota bacterium]
MRYRAEIDGLRAVAVVPVILFHAGLDVFSGGFVGVDVFFVISGYLITWIILSELRQSDFTIASFYERRARRILPALFLVMSVSLAVAYFWMLPEELENFGQSLLATTIFSNNILLARTSGYWALASEFKPLLHTWSLGVEEQYYVIFPLMMMAGWRLFRRHLVAVLVVLALISLLMAQWGVSYNPNATFYLLHTRGWELLLGSFGAFYMIDRDRLGSATALEHGLSLIGLIAIAVSIVSFSETTPSPSLYTLIPTVGTVLIILYTREGTLVHWLLSKRWVVAIGLISYSAYLWHHPLFAFARIYSIEEPGPGLMIFLSALTLALAYLSWRFWETPFRNKQRFSRRFIFTFSLIGSAFFILAGFILYVSHGIPTRVFPTHLASTADMYISYNQGAYEFKKDRFDSREDLNLLIVGNSYSRDFVNMTIETFGADKIDLIYRDDVSSCFAEKLNKLARSLLTTADVVVLASDDVPLRCVNDNLAFAQANGFDLFYAGTKHFGYNLNWITRMDAEGRKSQYNPLPVEILQREAEMAAVVPPDHMISLLEPVLKQGQMPITDGQGRLLSVDRMHLTKHGAQLFGQLVFSEGRYALLLGHAQSGLPSDP